MKRRVLFFLTLVGVALLLPETLTGQPGSAEALASQNLRGYNHMFIAYFIAWALILGWVISIARRLGRVEKALKE